MGNLILPTKEYIKEIMFEVGHRTQNVDSVREEMVSTRWTSIILVFFSYGTYGSGLKSNWHWLKKYGYIENV